MYPNSVVRDVFYHANDDGLKLYYSNVSISRATVWKVRNDPVVQMGWASRSVHGVSIDGLDVIHSRYVDTGGAVVPSAIIGASDFYSGGIVQPTQYIELSVSNITCEGPCPALMRITPLQSYSLHLQHVAFPDGLQKNSIGIGRSKIPRSDGCKMNLTIFDWTVGGAHVTMANFQSKKLGQLDIDASYWGEWAIH